MAAAERSEEDDPSSSELLKVKVLLKMYVMCLQPSEKTEVRRFSAKTWSRFLHFVSQWKTLEGLGPQAKIAADFSASCSGAAAVSDGADFPVMEGFTECATRTATLA